MKLKTSYYLCMCLLLELPKKNKFKLRNIIREYLEKLYGIEIKKDLLGEKYGSAMFYNYYNWCKFLKENDFDQIEERINKEKKQYDKH